MGKRIKLRDKIQQRSVGFNNRQHEFFDKYPEFNPDKFARKAVDEQIALIDPEFLAEIN